MKKASLKLIILLLVLIHPSFQHPTTIEQNNQSPAIQTQNMSQSLNSLPLYFVENKGQVDERIRYHLNITNANVFFYQDEIVYQFLHRTKEKNVEEGRLKRILNKGNEAIQAQNVRVRFLGSNKYVTVEGAVETEANFSYFQGNDPEKWVTGARAFHKVIYKEIYTNIDLIVYGARDRIKHEYRVKEGGVVESIKVRYEGIKQLRINEKGQLEIKTGGGILIEDVPVSYQIIDGKKIGIKTEYVLDDDDVTRFKVDKYRKDRELIIDPELDYSTYLGGSSGDWAWGMAIDGNGNVYVTGWGSADFPTTPGAYRGSEVGAFITKLNTNGTKLLYSTCLESGRANAIAIDKIGNAYVTGEGSADFPTTPGAYKRSGGGVFITKLNTNGTKLLYSTFLGSGSVAAIAIDGNGNAYVTGSTRHKDFPTTRGAYDRSYNGGPSDIFITKINPQGSKLVYSSYLGGMSRIEFGAEYDHDEAYAIAVDGSGNAYITGMTDSPNFPTTPGAYDRHFGGMYTTSRIFITKFNSQGTNLLYSTFLGGAWGKGKGIAVDGNGNAYITGPAYCCATPTTPDAYQKEHNAESGDAFISKLNSTGSKLLYSTLLGGSGNYDEAQAIAIDESGNAYIAGITDSTDFPTTANAYDTTFNGGWRDAFVSKINSNGTELLYSTYLGGSGWKSYWWYWEGAVEGASGLAIEGNGVVFVTGTTYSSDFPVTSDAYDTIFDGDSAPMKEGHRLQIQAVNILIL